MKEAEFRIGNYMNYTLYQAWHQGIIRTINNNSCNITNIGDSSPVITVKFRMIEPINLTEEWLLKFGFKKYSHEPGYALSEFNDIEERCDEYSKGNISIMDWCNGFILSNSFSFKLRVEIKFVHKLQNIYYDLTDEELIIKEEL